MSAARAGGLARRRLRRLSSAVRRPWTEESRKRYLDLVERAVLHTLYSPSDRGEPPAFVLEHFREVFKSKPMQMLGDEQLRAEGRDWPIYAQTMVGAKRLRNVRRCVETALGEGVEGDLIEAGCWRGGVAILMRAVLKAYGEADRLVFAADSFAGVPPPDPERFPADAGDLNYTADQLAVPVEEVADNFRRYDLLDGNVRFLEGLFRDTLPTVRDRTWAVVRLDGDLYESTMDGLENLYPGLAVGGFLIIDDYRFDNCRAAVEDFRREHGITEPIEEIDWTGAYWRRAA